jgi:predicted restriction endonuclease
MIDEYENHYLVFREIFLNWKKYNFKTQDLCFENLFIIMQDILKYDINCNELNEYLRITDNDELNRMQQNKFKENLFIKYKKCIITENDVDECEACHIIPLERKYSYDVNNGILLSSSLHKTFDKFIWSINPITSCIEINNENNKKYLINNFNNNKINLDKETLKNLEWHYEKFCEKKSK